MEFLKTIEVVVGLKITEVMVGKATDVIIEKIFVQNKKRVRARHLKIDKLQFKSFKIEGFEYKNQ